MMSLLEMFLTATLTAQGATLRFLALLMYWQKW
ncbi:hypothetical protein [Serratia fonticola]|nr:hypothetical protein [Serratia fonticola]CAI0885819.1 Uncharacterised protein [Serratia fonticola]